MNDFNTIDEILDYAINAEQQAIDFYKKLSESSTNRTSKAYFLEFAEEEVTHKEKLLKIKKEGTFAKVSEKIPDLKLSDYILKTLPTDITNYADALRLAMHREKAAFKLYSTIGRQVKDEGLKNLFTQLANEEAKHKLNFEMEYDDNVFIEN